MPSFAHLLRFFSEKELSDALEEHDVKVSIDGRTITCTNLLITLTLLLRKSRHWMYLWNDCTSYKMYISAKKTKLMTNSANGIH